MSITTQDVLNEPVESGYKYVLAYGIVIMLLIFISKTRIGYNTIYYTLVLSLFLLLVTQSQWIKNALAPINGNRGPLKG